MALKKSKFQPGETVYAKSSIFPEQTLIITLIKYIPNYEWQAEFIHPDTKESVKDYFDERDFD